MASEIYLYKNGSTASLPETITNHSHPIPPHGVLFVKFLCYQALAVPISCVGIFGNLMCIWVWTRKKMHSSTSYYLVVLAVSDLFYLLIINLVVLLPDWLQVNNQTFTNLFKGKSQVEVLHIAIGQPIIDVISNISVFSVVAFTIERYIAIKYPMKRMRLCTRARAKCILCSGALAVILLHIPSFLEHVPWMKRLGYRDSVYYRIGYNWGAALLFTITPLLVLTIFNTMLIYSVLNSKKVRRSMTTSARRPETFSSNSTYSTTAHQLARASSDRTYTESNYAVLTLTIIFLVMVFFLCHGPAAVVLCISTYRGYMKLITRQEQNSWSIAFAIANLLSMLSSSLNFLVYSVLSATFRKTALQSLWLYGKKSKTSLNNTGTVHSHDIRNMHERSTSQPLSKTKEDSPLLPRSEATQLITST